MDSSLTVVTFSHLRWDFVYQRPQHLLSRLAARYRVLYIEEPLRDAGAPPHWEKRLAEAGVLVCRPHTPVATPGFAVEQMPVLSTLLAELDREETIGDCVAWLYTPMAFGLAQALSPQAVVYDCMDELSLFLGAPPELVEREAELLRGADIVFTGGRSLYRAKEGRHHNLHCFPSSVDSTHFRQARRTTPSAGAPTLPEPADQASIPHPRLGYFGVIDERIDLPLLDGLARAHPEWQIVMVGPVVKIEPATLPRHPNIHYLGQRDYQVLPAYLGGWDVCLLPFARNQATRFISPTKTLEYMAAERPIVSTPITDVAEPYGDIVYLGDTPDGFVSACERALRAPEAERAGRIAKMRAVLAHTSWDTTARAMERLIRQVLASRRTEADVPSLAGLRNPPTEAPRRAHRLPVS